LLCLGFFSLVISCVILQWCFSLVLMDIKWNSSRTLNSGQLRYVDWRHIYRMHVIAQILWTACHFMVSRNYRSCDFAVLLMKCCPWHQQQLGVKWVCIPAWCGHIAKPGFHAKQAWFQTSPCYCRVSGRLDISGVKPHHFVCPSTMTSITTVKNPSHCVRENWAGAPPKKRRKRIKNIEPGIYLILYNLRERERQESITLFLGMQNERFDIKEIRLHSIRK
jgi:hypothetical protein